MRTRSPAPLILLTARVRLEGSARRLTPGVLVRLILFRAGCAVLTRRQNYGDEVSRPNAAISSYCTPRGSARLPQTR